MTISDELLAMEQKKNEVKVFYQVKNTIEGVYFNIAGLQDAVTQAQADGLFVSVPTETKQAYNRLYQLILQLKSAMESDPAFTDLIEQE